MPNPNSDREPRTVNPMLGSQPRLGPFPANQIFPWSLITGIIWFLAQAMSLPLIWTALLILWGDVTWWLLTGKTPWKFLSKFIGVPNLTRGRVTYRSIHSFESDTFQSAPRVKRKCGSPARNPKR